MRLTFATSAFVLVLLAVGCAAHRPPTPPSLSPELVELQTVAPHVRLDIRYATPNNFTGTTLYPVARCLLRPDVAQRVARAQAELEPMGLGLQVFDCYRPLSVQKQMWALVPDPRYVANPAEGSRHNRGAAVDVTLVRVDGSEIAMPTPYDDFGERAHRPFNDLPPTVRANRALLERVMTDAGFVPLPTEWWHFDAPDWQRYDVLDVPLQ